MHSYLVLGFAYLLGSIPFGLIFVKLSGRGDVRDIGSGNIGATNVLRTGSKVLAACTLLADALKGALAILTAKYVGLDETTLALTGLVVIIAHVFPVWLKFKGGKGVATALGVYLAINPLLGLCIALTWLAVAKVFKISSLAALIALFMAPIYTAALRTSIEVSILGIAIYLLIFWTHRDNIRRIMKGEESLIRRN
ncbi:glycerol-3-phosphate 1-O-acyltransferase PlsY [Candidatus Odyssella thessalonicensis]|uniref:glycerol-3-phosphate 1-O-acyltransferase PlsY n=1 Tax=Candidatus Odyssella thessalonicensis TaxID=84647 RepID=UPI000225BC58|nr:glycerol-3-phosphate 1-O-acyltransferase PlsY [Candidatus Odyssella thessalonicensis]